MTPKAAKSIETAMKCQNGRREHPLFSRVGKWESVPYTPLRRTNLVYFYHCNNALLSILIDKLKLIKRSSITVLL